MFSYNFMGRYFPTGVQVKHDFSFYIPLLAVDISVPALFWHFSSDFPLSCPPHPKASSPLLMQPLISKFLNTKVGGISKVNYTFTCFCFFFYLIYLWLHWVFVDEHGLSLVGASRGYSSLQCVGFSLRWLLLLWSTGSRGMGFSSCGMWAQ